jgi:hypothetical protein
MESNTHRTPATRQSWRDIQPLPAKRAPLSLQRELTEQECEQLSYGLIPDAMEDKWFIFLEGDTLYFHRSWTGICIYQLSLKRDGDLYQVVDAFVNRVPDQYTETNDRYDERLLLFLIDNLLLGMNTPFPNPVDLPRDIMAGVVQHNFSGTGYKEEEAPATFLSKLRGLLKFS